MRVLPKLLSGLAFASLCTASLAAVPVNIDFSKELVQVEVVAPGWFTFSQGGFSGGATVTGSFAGTDLDGNGQLSNFEGEVTAFAMSFSGNSKVHAFTLGFSSLFALVYDLNGGPLGDGLTGDEEGIGTFNLPEYIAGAGPFGAACDGTNRCGAVITAVPEPATWGGMLLGIAALGAVRLLIRSRPAARREVRACAATLSSQ